MSVEVLQVLAPGMGMTFQDLGRPGWKRFGVPPGGAMDQHAARMANRLVGNSEGAPVLEILWQGAKLRFIQESWFSVTGAGSRRLAKAEAGDILEFPSAPSGLWIYLAVQGGFAVPRFLGSASVYPRGKLGKTIALGDILCRTGAATQVAGVAEEGRDYAQPPAIRVWPGPQWALFSSADRKLLFGQPWTVSPQSDRVGYRLTGMPLSSFKEQMLSEPVRIGTIQVPENGLPIVTMRDGPTVGGYPKIGMVEPADLDWLAQCRPGTRFRFAPYEV